MFGNITQIHMAQIVGNGILLGTKPKLEETDTGTTTVEISMLDSFEDKITISQVISEPKSEIEICVDPAPEQASVEPPAVSAPAAPPAAPTAALPLETKWTVGAQCQAVWSEDGKEYAATVLSIEEERCRVRFDGYGNEESMPLSTLKPLESQPKGIQEWCAGSRCRASASDGLSYPAEVLWVQGQRCRVRFDHSNSEAELDVGGLLSTGELNGPGRTGRSVTWRPSFGTGARRRGEVPDATDKRETERDKGERGDRGGRDRTWREPQQSTWQAKERVPGQIREEREPEDRRPPDRGSAHTAQSVPPFPPLPLPHVSGDPPAFVPPPPPFWAFGAKEPSAPLDPTSQMLMMWYMCGFHTGSYLALQQSRSSSKD